MHLRHFFPAAPALNPPFVDVSLLSVPCLSPLCCCVICVYFRALFSVFLCLSLSGRSVLVSPEHYPTHGHDACLAVAAAAVLQMPQCAVISREIWGCYKLCTQNNRGLRISPFTAVVYLCLWRGLVFLFWFFTTLNQPFSSAFS